MGGRCSCCGKLFKAEAPEGFAPGSPFGLNLRAQALYLRTPTASASSGSPNCSLRRSALRSAKARWSTWSTQAATPSAGRRKRSRKDFVAGDVIASDETTQRVGKKKWQLWVFYHATSAVFRLKPSRGKDVVREFLGDHRPGCWVSERYGSQMEWAAEGRKLQAAICSCS